MTKLDLRALEQLARLRYSLPRSRRRRLGSRYAHRGSLAKLVQVPELLYHGTDVRNLPGIFQVGELVPGKGMSPHRTATKGAVFLTNEPVNAIMYGSAFGSDRSFVVFEVATRGLEVLLDYDDVGQVLGWDLDELRNLLLDEGIEWEPEVGKRIPSDEIAHDIQGLIESMDSAGDRAIPMTLSVEWSGGQPYLYAQPYLCQGIADDALRAALDYDLYEWIEDPIGDGVDVSYDEGQPCILTLQYMVMGAISLERVKRVFVSKRWLDDHGVAMPRGAKVIEVVNPGYIHTPLDEDGYAMTVDEAIDAGIEDQVGFSKHMVVETTIPELRAELARARKQGSSSRRR